MTKARGSLLFSAHSLQAYVDCERRFELSYLEELEWPAVESEPLLESERHMADGRRFHEMVHRDALGLAVSAPRDEGDEDIARWWRNYETHRPGKVSGDRFSEKTLVGSIREATLVATCDRIVTAGDGGRVRIFDWKTWRQRHSREWLARRMQTRVYPYLLVTAGAPLAGGKAVAPEDVEMAYWYADFPEKEEVFAYSEGQFWEDEAYLTGLVQEILEREAGAFERTTNEKQCSFCAYRSFCDRGDVAGHSDDEPEEDAPNPLAGSLDDYEEIAF
jgi:hypothetical protein